MAEIAQTHDATEDVGGKELWCTVEYTDDRPVGPDKSVLDIVTDDGVIYRFEQLRSGDPWSFAPGNTSDRIMSQSGRLPGVVEAIVAAEFTDDDGNPDPGVIY